MKAYINKAAVVAEIDRLQEATMDKNQNFLSSYHEGIFDGLSMLEKFFDTLEVKEVQEEPISNDLEEAADNYVGHAPEIDEDLSCFIRRNAFIAGAQWQKEQMEKNRIAHCDNITEEQYNLETGFIDEHLKKYNRIPTILDAIEYGMQKQITKACEWLKINKDHPLIGCEDPCLSGYLTDKFIEEFKKAMEDKL